VPSIDPIELILVVLSPVLLIVIGVFVLTRRLPSAKPLGWPRPPALPGIAPTLSDQLRELEDAKDAGLVTEEEYVARRKRILGVR
jgi:hypothetical protein